MQYEEALTSFRRCISRCKYLEHELTRVKQILFRVVTGNYRDALSSKEILTVKESTVIFNPFREPHVVFPGGGESDKKYCVTCKHNGGQLSADSRCHGCFIPEPFTNYELEEVD